MLLRGSEKRSGRFVFSQRHVLITIFWRVEYGKFNIWPLPLMCVLEVVGISDIR